MMNHQLKAGFGKGVIRFPKELFPVEGLIGIHDDPCALDNAVMETKDRQVSADICGVCSTMTEEKYGVPALFCVSAAGDQMPKEQAWYEEAVPGGRSRLVEWSCPKGNLNGKARTARIQEYPRAVRACTYAIEPPYTERYVRWCERSARYLASYSIGGCDCENL